MEQCNPYKDTRRKEIAKLIQKFIWKCQKYIYISYFNNNAIF